MSQIWKMLGGDERVAKIVDAFVELVIRDPKVNYTRDGRFLVTPEAIAFAKQEAYAFISAATGGPVPYTGRPLIEIHRSMKIKDAEFDAFLDCFKVALEQNDRNPEVVGIALQMVNAARSHVVL